MSRVHVLISIIQLGSLLWTAFTVVALVIGVGDWLSDRRWNKWLTAGVFGLVVIIAVFCRWFLSLPETDPTTASASAVLFVIYRVFKDGKYFLSGLTRGSATWSKTDRALQFPYSRAVDLAMLHRGKITPTGSTDAHRE